MKNPTLATLASAAFLIPAGLLLTGCIYSSFPAKASRKDQTIYSLDPGGRIELLGFNGRIQVIRWDGKGVRIERTITCCARTDEEANRGLDLIAPEVLSDTGRLLVKYSDPRSFDHRFQVDLHAEVPEDSSLVLRTSNGGISIDGIHGGIDARTSNGDVAAREGGRSEVQLHTSNGRIIGEHLDGKIVARTSNGKVELRGCTGKIEASTSNGGVEIDAAAGGAGDILAETSNGGVRCVLPDSYAGLLDASTSNGTIRCDFPVSSESSPSKCRVVGKIGAGGPQLRLHTTNGGITIQQAGPRAVPAEEPPRPAGGARKV